MATAPQRDRDARLKSKRAQAGDEELRHRVRPGTLQMLGDLMSWHGIEEKSEAIQLLIMNAHALGPEGSGALLQIPRHEITISENVEREFERKSLAILSREED